MFLFFSDFAAQCRWSSQLWERVSLLTLGCFSLRCGVVSLKPLAVFASPHAQHPRCAAVGCINWSDLQLLLGCNPMRNGHFAWRRFGSELVWWCLLCFRERPIIIPSPPATTGCLSVRTWRICPASVRHKIRLQVNKTGDLVCKIQCSLSQSGCC